jgi:hypothetical protein
LKFEIFKVGILGLKSVAGNHRFVFIDFKTLRLHIKNFGPIFMLGYVGICGDFLLKGLLFNATLFENFLKRALAFLNV